jgi:hypothetical protein
MATQSDPANPPSGGAVSARGLFLGVLAAGMALRLVLAFVVFPSKGFATDMDQFASWVAAILRAGPGGFYAASGANYPPAYMYVLWLVGVVAGWIGPLLGTSTTAATVFLLKLPPVLADGGIAILLYAAGSRWFGGRTGIVAAALYLFVPVTWYDSALWGQVDAAGALVALAAVLALADGWSATALVLAVVAALVKPQEAIALVVVLPVLVRRHLLHAGTGPEIRAGARLAALDRRLGGLVLTRGPFRLVTAVAAAAIAGLAILLPFDIARFAPSGLASVPLVGQLAGYAGLFGNDSGQYSFLTANAFNAWALVGASPLASIASSGGSWTGDSLVLLGGLTAFQLGTALLVCTGLAIGMGLLVRDDRTAILLAFGLAAFAFYALPTRVHERYLFPFFTAAALLAAPYAGGAVSYVGVALMNGVNLHAVLGSPSMIGGGSGRGGSFTGPGTAGTGGGGFQVTPGGRGGTGGSGASSITLPFTDLARSEFLVTAVAVGQTLAFAALLGLWLVVAFGPLLRRPQRAAAEPLGA